MRQTKGDYDLVLGLYPTEMLGHDSKSEIGKVLRFWDKTHKLEELY